MNRTEIINLLTETLSKPRFDHCLRVESSAVELANYFQTSPEIVSPAALLHDLCREYSREKLLKLAVDFDIVVDDIEKAEPLLLHGPVAAAMAQKTLGINNDLILDAIRFHITGSPNMTSVAKLIFIADFIEPGRTFEQARILREMVYKLTPDQLLLKVYNHSIEYIIRQGYLLHPRTVAGRNELIMKGVSDL